MAIDKVFKRYLEVLGVSVRRVSQEYLKSIVSAHMLRIPFENISKLHYHKTLELTTLPSLEQYLDGIERYHFGGTCITNNTFLNQLLVHLGFDARLCGADMSKPDCHFVNIVTVEGREYLVDAGYAAPFFQPLRRDLPHDLEIALGRDRYVLRPQDTHGRSRMDLYRDGELVHGYTAKPIGRDIDYFAEVIRESYQPESAFMSSLLMVKMIAENRTVAIRNLTVIKSEGSEYSIHRLPGQAELPVTVEKFFGIPRRIVADAIDGLRLTDGNDL